ncbi:MAG: hypothetical protein Q6361_05205 [Candidatus Hermodarchaeota archaeon]|nr:hypothetical protein [Candidatus Hermodarchaeota archaeon]
MPKSPLMTNWIQSRHDIPIMRRHLPPIFLLLGSLLAIWAYWSPWAFMTGISMWNNNRPYISLVFFCHINNPFFLGTFLGTLVGIIAALSILARNSKPAASPYPSLAMVGLFLIPWISFPALSFLFDHVFGIFSPNRSPVYGYLEGLPLNLIAIALIITGTVLALHQGDSQGKRKSKFWAILFFVMLNLAAFIAILSSLFPWGLFPPTFTFLPLTTGLCLILTSLYTLEFEPNLGVLQFLVCTSLLAIFLTALHLLGFIARWMLGNSFPFLYLTFSPFPRLWSIGPILFFFDGLLLLLLGILITVYASKFNPSSLNQKLKVSSEETKFPSANPLHNV